MQGALQADGRRIYFFGALGGLLFGYDTGVISGAILFITEDFGLSPFMQGAVVASLLLGAMVGAALAGPLSDRLGRKRLIMIAAVTFTVGAIAAAVAPSAWALVARPLRDRARRGLRRARGPALPVRDRPHPPARRDRFAQPADDRGGDPGGVHRQRHPGLVRRLAADARTWPRCPP